jgi:hypothetical protein
MASAPNPDKSAQFTAMNASESICMRCYATIRAIEEVDLEEAQQRHLKECRDTLGRLDSLAP